jgi:hypothetical protein
MGGGTAADLLAEPARAARVVRERAEVGLVVVIDQLEETIATAAAAEREAFFAALAAFGELTPGVRLLVTLRSDFLDRLATVAAVGRDLLRATTVLAPMPAEALRRAVVGPARASGFAFETESMVDALVAEAVADGGGGAMPLLSFVLAELWNARDRARRVLPKAALARLGGSAAALARHGDVALAALTPNVRREARRILLALVNSDGTRVRAGRNELVGADDGGSGAALDGLVQARLVVAGETYEIAHPALAVAWPRLRAWMDEASDARATATRLTASAADWQRLGRQADMLWGERQLRDLEAPGALDGASEEAHAFAEASRTAVWRARLRRWALRAAAPFAVLLVVVAVVGGLRWRERLEDRRFVDARLVEADSAVREVEAVDAAVERARADAFARFDAGDSEGGEAKWVEALALVRRESDAFVTASAPLGLALARSPRDGRARKRAADLTYAWLLAAERDHETAAVRDLTARLGQLDDDGSHQARLSAPAQLRVSASPAGARIVLHAIHVATDGRRVEDEGRPIDLNIPVTLAPGSYMLAASAPERYPTRYPVMLGRGDDTRVEVPLPPATSVPEGFVFVPGGTLLIGEVLKNVRAVLNAPPLHPLRVDAFLIGAHKLRMGATSRFSRSSHPTSAISDDHTGPTSISVSREAARQCSRSRV